MLPLLMLVGCGSGIESYTAAPTDLVQTVVRVRWPAEDGDEDPRVMWGTGSEPDQRIDAIRRGAFFEALLPGQPQLTELSVRPEHTHRGATMAGETRTVEVGLLPDGTPRFTIETPQPDLVDDPYVIAAVIARENWVLVLDRDGEVLWYYPVPEGFIALHVEEALEGGSLLINLNHNDRTQDRAAIVRLGFDGEVLEYIHTPRGHHSFTQVSPGVFAYPAIEVRDAGEDQRVVGDTVVVREADGEIRVVFNCFNHLNVVFEEQAPFYPQGYDWTHANSLHYDEDSNTFLLSLANLDTVIQFDPETREPLLMLGKEGSYIFDPPESQFDFQHDVQWLGEDRLLLFDSPQGEQGYANAKEIVLDRDMQVATEVWSSPGGREIHVSALGSVERLDNGNTLTSWGASGELIEVDPAGDVAWKLITALGSGFTTVKRFDHDEVKF